MTLLEKIIVLTLMWIASMSLLTAYFKNKFKKEEKVLPPEKDYKPFV